MQGSHAHSVCPLFGSQGQTRLVLLNDNCPTWLVVCLSPLIKPENGECSVQFCTFSPVILLLLDGCDRELQKRHSVLFTLSKNWNYKIILSAQITCKLPISLCQVLPAKWLALNMRVFIRIIQMN